MFPTVSQNTYKLALLPPSKYTKALFSQSSHYSEKTVAGFQNVFAVSKVKLQRKSLARPTVFVSEVSIANENQSELRCF